MGMFSWKCCVSGESLANIDSSRPNKSSCYLVTPDKTYYESAYEGYGEFDGVDIYELLGDGDRNKGIKDDCEGKRKFEIKIVLEEHYNGQNYDVLKSSEDCPYQGFFFDDEKE